MRERMRSFVLLLVLCCMSLTLWAAPATRTINSAAQMRANRLMRGAGGTGVESDKSLDEQLKELPKGTNGVPLLQWNKASVDLILKCYAQQAGKILLPSPNLPKAEITLDSKIERELTKEEFLEAIEVALTMNGIVLEPFDNIFIRAFPRDSVRTQGIRTSMTIPTNAIPEKGRVISQLIRLQHMTPQEAEEAFNGFKSKEGQVQKFERNNSILITDTQENVNRMLEIVKELDFAAPILEETFEREIRYAAAQDIKTALDTIVEDAQKDEQNKKAPAQSGVRQAGHPGFTRNTPTPGGVGMPRRAAFMGFTPGQSQPEIAAPANSSFNAAMSDADRGMIRGKVLIVADDRSNKLIIITQKTNMDAFDKIIKALDVPTTPEVSVDVVRLKYADSEDVASMLNDLIGNNSSSSSKGNQNQRQPSANAPRQAGAKGSTPTRPGQSNSRTANPTFSKSAAASLGELNKDNIKILADKRINGIVVMARKDDMKAVKRVIDDMDVKLSQVLIETVIVQVELGDDLNTGIDWVQRGRNKTSVQATDSYGRKLFYGQDGDGNIVPGLFLAEGQTSGGNVASTTPVMKRILDRDNFFNNGSYMLGGGGGSGKSTLQNLMGIAQVSSAPGGYQGSGSNAVTIAANAAAETLVTKANPIGGGINYFLKSDKLNIAAVLQAAKGDSRTKVLASPILMTVDNKEATIEATDMIYLFSGYQYSGSSYNGTQVRNYEKRDIGLTVKVTPRINPNGTVVLTVEQTFETQGADQNVPNESGGTDPYATVTTRKIQSDVSVENRQTVVMGGLTKKTNTESENGIPFLKDIPWIGKWLFSSVTQSEKRSELLVFMTPYVLDESDEAQAEAIRRKKVLSDPRPWEDNGWSLSPVADPVARKEQLRRLNDEWKKQDEERKNAKEMEEAKEKRVKKLMKMDAEEREEWAKAHEKEIAEEQARFDGEQKDLRKIIDSIREKHQTSVEKELPTLEKKADEKADAKAKEALKPIEEVKK